MSDWVGIPILIWKITVTLIFIIISLIAWFYGIRPFLISRFRKWIGRYSKSAKGKGKLAIARMSINFGVIPYIIGITTFLIIVLDIWSSKVVRGGSAFGLISLGTVAIIQTKLGSGFLSGYELMFGATFDEGDWVGMKNTWGIWKEGQCKEIGTHATRFRDRNNLEFHIFNHEIMKMREIVNYSRQEFYFISVPIIPMPEESMALAVDLISELNKRKTVGDLLNLRGLSYGWWKDECNSKIDVTPMQWARIINPGIDYEAEVPSLRIPVLNKIEADDVRRLIKTRIDGATPLLPVAEPKKEITTEEPKHRLPIPHLKKTPIIPDNDKPKPPIQFNAPIIEKGDDKIENPTDK